jgi:hypothetical protein
MYIKREKTVEDFYDQYLSEGRYEESTANRDTLKAQYASVQCLQGFAKRLKTIDMPHFDALYNAYYDILVKLCHLIVKTQNITTESDQAVFAFIAVKFPELELDWGVLESLRIKQQERQHNNHEILKDEWKQLELQFEIYIQTLTKELEKKIS